MESNGDDEVPDELPSIKLCRNSRKDKLDVSNSRLQSIPVGVFDLTHLQYLYLEGNQIKEIPEKLCENLVHLLWFDLRRNELKNLPVCIGKLEKLKHFLLEGNQIEELPVQLGDLVNLRSLNLRYNPLKFPPKNIIMKGTIKILEYLRQNQCDSEKIEHYYVNEVESEEVHPINSKLSTEGENGEGDNFKESFYGEKPIYGEKPRSYYYANDLPDEMRRSSLEENMLQLLRYSANSLEVKQRSKPTYSLPVLKNKTLHLEPLKNSKKTITFREDKRKSSYHKKLPKKLTHQHDIERYSQRKLNEKTNKKVQSLKDKRLLDDWRRKPASNSSKQPDQKHEIVIPYGHSISPTEETVDEADMSVKGRKDQRQRQPKTDRLSLDEQLEKRIKEHVQNIKNWRRNHNNDILSLKEELSESAKNFEKAQMLKKELQEKRAKEYRFRAFTGGDFAPPSHSPSN